MVFCILLGMTTIAICHYWGLKAIADRMHIIRIEHTIYILTNKQKHDNQQ